MYKLSDTCVIETRNEQDEVVVIIRDIVSGNFVEIPPTRWASFLLLQNNIDSAIKQLREKKDYVKYFEHFGAGWYASVTTGLWCVDIRRFYFSNDCEIKPTKNGITLQLPEWTALQNLLPLLMSFTPELLMAYPCSLRADHKDLRVLSDCRECKPFEDVIG
jgi:hypothetical protein